MNLVSSHSLMSTLVTILSEYVLCAWLIKISSTSFVFSIRDDLIRAFTLTFEVLLMFRQSTSNLDGKMMISDKPITRCHVSKLKHMLTCDKFEILLPSQFAHSIQVDLVCLLIALTSFWAYHLDLDLVSQHGPGICALHQIQSVQSLHPCQFSSIRIQNHETSYKLHFYS